MSDPVTVYKLDTSQVNGCTQLNLFGQGQAQAYEAYGYKNGTCNGAGYTRFGGCPRGICSQGSQWLK